MKRKVKKKMIEDITNLVAENPISSRHIISKIIFKYRGINGRVLSLNHGSIHIEFMKNDLIKKGLIVKYNYYHKDIINDKYFIMDKELMKATYTYQILMSSPFSRFIKKKLRKLKKEQLEKLYLEVVL